MAKNRNEIDRFFSAVGFITVVVVLLTLFSSLPTRLFEKLTVEESLKKADAIVVLGAGVTLKETPDRNTLQRLVKGIILYKEGYAPTLILVGGWDHDGYIAAAKVMKKTAVKLGVDPKDIITESTSHNTYENAVNTKSILREHKYDDIILVTSASHMRRSLEVFEKQGIKTYPAPTEEKILTKELRATSKIHNFNLLFQVVYEKMAYLKYRLFGWV